ncbi:hypothetical protein PHLGIDRAFT_128902 [Phlebiopsis gigantea 11061_1 CR5-6]|uniref:Galactose mutarotase-like protein n=1 Tax=Phlebiopsis gigantea (strain 11061_1 CR5-6) TaxID=745531 RepID=A0A0C3S560_PHLG1|nr:hypothetical protein PHLGIDRAFT_128902 [Phlebiopsis gigantea 11061_1 CR5-6]
MSTDPRFTPVLLALPSFTPSLALEVLPHGATLHRLFVQADGKTHDVLVGPERPEDHLRQKYTNTIVGRYANRLPVPAAPVTLTKGAATAQFFPQANEKPAVSLHGGVAGFDSHVWEPTLDIRAATLFTPAEVAFAESRFAPQSAAVFARTSPDGEEGFPGALRVETLVALVPPSGKAIDDATGAYCLGSVLIVYRAKLEGTEGVTPINLTQHWGFNLDASLQDGEPTIKEHKLSIQAAHTLELDADTALATGRLVPVGGTHHDHAAKTTGTLGEAFDGGYDEFYLFDAPPHAVPARLPASALADPAAPDTLAAILAPSPTALAAAPLVALAGARSGLSLVFDSNQSGVQLYTNNFAAPARSARKAIHGGSGVFGEGGYAPGSAAFLEFHAPLGAFAEEMAAARGRSGEDTLLAAGEVYNNFVRADVWWRPGA